MTTSDDPNTPSNPTPENGFVSRKQLAVRWDCSVETVKRTETRLALKKYRLGPRTVRYRMADIIAIEGTI